jgi:hypothetical protein
MAHGFGTGDQARLSNEPQLFGCKCTDNGFLIERIQQRAQRKKRGNPLDDLPEPPALVIGKRLPTAPIRLPIAKPLMRDLEPYRRSLARQAETGTSIACTWGADLRHLPPRGKRCRWASAGKRALSGQLLPPKLPSAVLDLNGSGRWRADHPRLHVKVSYAPKPAIRAVQSDGGAVAQDPFIGSAPVRPKVRRS